MEVQALMRQRDELTKEGSRLQQRVDTLRQQASSGKGGGPANNVLEQKFEGALQVIGKLQEELEACREQRDAYKQQCNELARKT